MFVLFVTNFPASYLIGSGVFSPRVKRPEHEIDDLTLSSAKDKPERSYNATPSLCLPGMDMENFM
jgi:hypothetical protein